MDETTRQAAQAIGATEAAWLLAHILHAEIGAEALKRHLAARTDYLETALVRPPPPGGDLAKDAFGQAVLRAELSVLLELFARLGE